MAYYAAVGIGAYAAISLTFFCFPNIIHKRKRYESVLLEEALNSPSHKTLLVAHRGGMLQVYQLFMKLQVLEKSQKIQWRLLNTQYII